MASAGTTSAAFSAIGNGATNRRSIWLAGRLFGANLPDADKAALPEYLKIL